MITVFTKPDCADCEHTKAALSHGGVEFTVVDLFSDRDALRKVKALGFRAAPVVVTDDDTWSGYRPDKISALISSQSSDDIWN